MSDKSSTWSIENGLKALVTSLLAMNMVGYSFVIPDMVGGNGYTDFPTKELFIRWLQANTFMPTIQFSYAPWDFDEEVRNAGVAK
jgi:alpha-glucosidase (family GH31 glycosyl hydrolase)